MAAGASLDSLYEIYSYERVNLSAEKIAAGQRPADLIKEEQASYDVACAPAAGRQLP